MKAWTWFGCLVAEAGQEASAGGAGGHVVRCAWISMPSLMNRHYGHADDHIGLMTTCSQTTWLHIHIQVVVPNLV